MEFKTNFIYTVRKTKARYIYLKYQPILAENILDVGADQCHLKKHLSDNVSYIGIGLSSDKIDLEIDLEKQPLPYEDNAFNVVLCTDVLEHLENMHEVFDELCRVSKKYVIISLPNPHSVFWNYVKHGNYDEYQHLKFYGLPLEKPDDRHKWFFSVEEAENFIRYRANKNNMGIIQIDIEGNSPNKINFFKKIFLKILLRKNYNLYFNLISNKNLYSGTLWAVLKKEAP